MAEVSDLPGGVVFDGVVAAAQVGSHRCAGRVQPGVRQRSSRAARKRRSSALGRYRSTATGMPVVGSVNTRSHPGARAARRRASPGSMGPYPVRRAGPPSGSPARVRAGIVTWICAVTVSIPAPVARVEAVAVRSRSVRMSARTCANVRESFTAVVVVVVVAVGVGVVVQVTSVARAGPVMSVSPHGPPLVPRATRVFTSVSIPPKASASVASAAPSMSSSGWSRIARPRAVRVSWIACASGAGRSAISRAIPSSKGNNRTERSSYARCAASVKAAGSMVAAIAFAAALIRAGDSERAASRARVSYRDRSSSAVNIVPVRLIAHA